MVYEDSGMCIFVRVWWNLVLFCESEIYFEGRARLSDQVHQLATAAHRLEFSLATHRLRLTTPLPSPDRYTA